MGLEGSTPMVSWKMEPLFISAEEQPKILGVPKQRADLVLGAILFTKKSSSLFFCLLSRISITFI